jgi:hypothetical protein
MPRINLHFIIVTSFLLESGLAFAANTFPASGNVGIGTTSPAATLNLGGSGSATAGRGMIVGTVSDSIATAVPLGKEVGRFEIGFPGWRDCEPNQIGAKVASIRMNRYTNNSALVQGSDLAFFTGGGSNPPPGSVTCNDTYMASFHDTSYERMRIDASGRVGIGTATPVALLDVASGSEGQAGPVTAIAIEGPNSPNSSNSAQDLSYNFRAAGSARIRAYRGSSWDTYLQFLTNPALPGGNNPVPRMTIDYLGNVGIGTTNPAGILHINGAGWADQTVAADSSNFPTSGTTGFIIDGGYSTGQYRTRFAKVDRGSNLALYVQQTLGTANSYSNVARFGTHALSSNSFEVFGNTALDGNVGIGTQSPGVPLDVIGNIRSSASVTAPCVATSSDLRLKTKIEPLNESLEKILELSPVHFRWKDAKLDNKLGSQVGFIAQDVEKVFPEVVLTDEKGYKSVNYSALVSPTVEAIKELSTQVAKIDGTQQKQMVDLQNENASLKAESALLKNENSQIKAYLCAKDPSAAFCQP